MCMDPRIFCSLSIPGLDSNWWSNYRWDRGYALTSLFVKQRFQRYHNCLIWIFRGSIIYVITSFLQHWFVKRMHLVSLSHTRMIVDANSQPRAQIGSINIGFGLLNHHLACFFRKLNKRKVKVNFVMRAWKQTQNIIVAWEHSLKKHRKTHDRALWHKTNQKRMKRHYILDKALEFMSSRR